MKEILLRLSEAPSSQIDAAVCLRLKALAENPNATELQSIVDSCARFSLASDFAMAVMNLLLIHLKMEEEATK